MARFELDHRLQLSAAFQQGFATELGQAIDQLSDQGGDDASAVHRFRVSTKRNRALLRLVSSGMAGEDYARKNQMLRDAARCLSTMRDRTVLKQVIEDLIDELCGESRASLQHLLGVLQTRELTSRISEREAGVRKAVHLARGVLQEELTLQEEGLAGCVRKGFERSYRRGRKRFASLDFASSGQVHELRKAAKMHRYQLGLLTPFFPPVLAGHEKAVKKLGKTLGSIHDLDVLRARVLELPSGTLLEGEQSRILDVLSEKRDVLCNKANDRARLVFAESPPSFARRMKKYIRQSDTARR